MYLLDTLLWRYSRRYRRRKLRRAFRGMTTEPTPPHAPILAPAQLQTRPRDARMLDALLERPAILTRATLSPMQVELLREKLADEAIIRGHDREPEPEPEYWCEHCPQYGFCCVCGQTHERTRA